MRKPKLIASDIDGTMLANWVPRFSPQMLGLVKRIVDAGIVFVPSSGRQYTNLQRLFSPVADRIPYVCENGSLAIADGELVYRATMEDDLAREIIKDMLADPGCEPVVSGMRTVYVRTGVPELVDHLVNVTGYNVTELDDVTHILEPFMKVSAYCTDGVPRERHWHERFGTRCTVKVTGLQWLDLMPNGVDKGVALAALAERLGIDAGDCMVSTRALPWPRWPSAWGLTLATAWRLATPRMTWRCLSGRVARSRWRRRNRRCCRWAGTTPTPLSMRSSGSSTVPGSAGSEHGRSWRAFLSAEASPEGGICCDLHQKGPTGDVLSPERGI